MLIWRVFTESYIIIVNLCVEFVANVLWGPNYKLDEDLVEKVQRKGTKLVDI